MSGIPGDGVIVHEPHPVEAAKRERIEAESRIQGTDPALHPGWHFWLCATCGNFHPSNP